MNGMLSRLCMRRRRLLCRCYRGIGLPSGGTACKGAAVQLLYGRQVRIAAGTDAQLALTPSPCTPALALP